MFLNAWTTNFLVRPCNLYWHRGQTQVLNNIQIAKCKESGEFANPEIHRLGRPRMFTCRVAPMISVTFLGLSFSFGNTCNKTSRSRSSHFFSAHLPCSYFKISTLPVSGDQTKNVHFDKNRSNFALTRSLL